LPVDPTLNSSSVVPLRRCLPASLRLSPPINLPALPVDPTSDSSTIVFSVGAFRLTLDSRLRSTFQLAFPSSFDLRLRLIFGPVFESNFRLTACHQFEELAVLISASSSGYCPVNLRLAPAFNPSASPSRQPSTRVSSQPSGVAFPTRLPILIDCQILQPAFRSISSLRLQPIFRPSLPANLQLAPFDSRLQSTFQLRLPTDLRPSSPADPPACLPTDFQLAPSAYLPAQPSRSLPACAFR
jgi:hypothetical protein